MNTHVLTTFQSKIVILAFVCLIVLARCGGSDPEPKPAAPTEKEKITEILTANGGTWAPSAVTIDGVDVTDDLFPGFSITFAEKTFTTTGTSPVWLREDTWTFKDETAQVIIRGQDSKEIAIVEISPTQLKLTLDWEVTTNDGGRKGSLKGKHEFLLNK